MMLVLVLLALIQTSPQAAVDELLAADRAFSASAMNAPDLAAGLGAMFADDVVMQVPGNRLIDGKANALEYLRSAADATARAEWSPIRGGISGDGRHGFTFGFMTIHHADGTRTPMKYMSYWIKGSDGWRADVYKRRVRPAGAVTQAMMPPAVPSRMIEPSSDTSSIERLRQSLGDAERAFSRDAQKLGIGPAFTQYGSADAVNMGGQKDPGFTVGAEAIGKAIGAGYTAGASPVSWGPDHRVIVASSGDLGVTVGWIRPNTPADGKPTAIPFFTIWRRGSTSDAWRYVAE